MARSAAKAKKKLTRILHSKEYETDQMSVKRTVVETLEADEGKTVVCSNECIVLYFCYQE